MRPLNNISRNRYFISLAILLIGRFSYGQEIGPNDDFEEAASNLSPGDELILRGGTYFFDENVSVTANGTPEQSITIRAKDGEQPIIEQATSNHNVIEISNSSHLIVRGIEFTGGSHGIRLQNSDFITIEDCEIHKTGDVAISANSGGTYEGLIIRRNHIHDTSGTGEGMYLGCNNDGCRVANSLIEGNYIHHTNGPSVSQGDGIELKEGSYGNVIRNNVIHDTNYPGILVYSVVGNGAANVIEGNVIWNVLDNTVQIAADAIFRNNIVLGNLAMQSHQAGSPSNIEVVHNTIITSGTGIDVRNVTGSVLLANNAIYAQGTAIRLNSGDLNQVQLFGNVGTGGLSGGDSGYIEGNGVGIDMIDGNFIGAPPIDPFPAPGSSLIGAGDPDYATEEDFNGNPRNGVADAGAYKYQQNGNPGWSISTDFKSSPDLFADVPSNHWAYSFIEALASTGITSGCGGGNYCPDDPVSRAQMAVFLERGINGSSYVPPAATGNVFQDVGAGDFAANFIEQLASDDITAGCGNNNYCPTAEITRDQMAVFLLRARYGSAHSPPPATGVFGDVDSSHWAAAWIEHLAAEGITAGCGNENYCPDAVVTRDQMAVFLVRTFGL